MNSFEQQVPQAPAPPPQPGAAVDRRPRFRFGLIAAGVVIGVILAGLGVAGGQTGETGPPVPPPGAATDEPRLRSKVAEAGRPHRLGKHFGMGMDMPMGGIHGEFTTRAPGGGFQVIATQKGEVTEVSAGSITVKSEDDFSRTYSVDDNTLVNAGNDGIADVKQGDNVHVMAVVRDGKASAVNVMDVTRVRELHERWNPGPPPRGEKKGEPRGDNAPPPPPPPND